MKNTYLVHAILRTLSPLHITSTESHRYEVSPDGYGQVRIGSKGGDCACTGIQKLQFARNGGAANGLKVPVIAANNIAGRMRRQAAKIILDVLKSKNQKIDLNTYSVLTCGAVNGGAAKSDLTYQEYQAASNDPYLGLFGGGPNMVTRRMQVFNALPANAELRDAGYSISHPVHEAIAELKGMSSAACFKRGDDIRQMLDVDRMVDNIENFEETFNQRQQEILADLRSKADGLDGDRNSTITWTAIEFVNPGVDFDLTFQLKDVTPAQVGLFLESLERFAQEAIGGQVRNGFGRITLNDVQIGVQNKDTRQFNYSKTSVFNNNSLVREGEAKAYLNAWKDAIEHISAAKLMELVKGTMDEKLAEKKAEKKAKAADLKAKQVA